MADTKVSALTNASALGTGDEFHIVQGGNDRAASAAQMAAFVVADATSLAALAAVMTKKAAAATMAAGAYESWLVLAAASSSISSPTLVTVMEMTGVGVGRYYFECNLVYQTTATTTGINVGVDHTGTLTQFVQEAYFVATTAAAATKAASQIDQASAAGAYEAESNRTKNTAIGTSGNFIISVDTANADMIVHITGFFVVSVTGSLQIKLGSESGVLVCTAREGSTLILRKFS